MKSQRSQALRMILVYVAVLLVALCALALADFFASDINRAIPASGPASFQSWFGESALIALTVAIAGVAVASFGGYLIARFPLLRRRSGFGGAFLVQLGPAVIVLGGLAFLLARLGRIESWLSLLGIYVITGLPFCLWQMVRSYRAISPKLEEAAELEGASIGHSFARVVLPLAACALIVTGLFSVVLAWIEYVIAGLLLRTTGMFPLPVAPTGGASVSDAVVSLVATGAVTLFFLLSRLLTIRSIGSEVDL